MTQIIRAIHACRWLAIVAATFTIAACDGGPATTATTAAADSAAVTSAANPPVSSPPAVTLSWVAPDENTDGTALTNLAGYRIYYGTVADALTEVINVPTVGVTDYVIDNLAAGTYYFSIRAYTTAGIESTLSTVVSTTIG
jgi:hypothetical protein